MSQGGSRWLDALHASQRELWLFAVLLYGVGDALTTVYGLERTTVAEAGPLAHHAIEFAGLSGFLSVKLGVLALFGLGWYSLRTPGRAAIPLALAVTGLGVTGWNVLVLFV